MRQPPGLEDVKTAVALAPALDIPQKQPCVHQRGYVYLRLLQGIRPAGQRAHQRRDLFRFQKIDHPQQHVPGLGLRAGVQQRGDGIHHHDARIELLNGRVHLDQMHFEPSEVARVARNWSRPLSIQRCKSTPTDRMFRTTWPADSSNEK